MLPTDPVFAALVLAAGFAVAWGLSLRFSPPRAGAFSSIEGLRGLLALSVVVHHGCIWFFYLRSGRWTTPPSGLYTHLGQSSVAMFFMVTALLFFSKLMVSKQHPLDWVRLFVGRWLRLVPLYALSLGLMLLLVGQQASWTLHQSLGEVLGQVWQWLWFCLPGTPDINWVNNTYTLVAGVFWSLPYEWLFYLALPVFGFVYNPTRHNALWALAGVAGLWLAHKHFVAFNANHLQSFLGGVVAAYAARVPLLQRWAKTPWASAVVVASLAAVVLGLPSAYMWPATALLTLAFGLVACGNTVFGVLTLPASRMLGQTGYGIYVLHGLVLFVALRLLVKDAEWLAPWQFWGVVAGCAGVVVLLAFVAHVFIEAPAMQATGRVRAWLRRHGI